VLPSQNQEAAVRSALAAGADDYLTMPVGMHDLMRRVRLWLRGVEAAIPGSRANRSGLQVHTLGRFYVEYRGEVRLYEGGKARKACALFKFLLTHHGRFVAASTVQELLWPGVPESIAVVDLRSMLYQLRKLLKGASQSAWPLEHTGTTLRLCLSPDDWWDADEFSAWLVEAAKLRRAGAIDQAMAAYKAAIALYKGDYLEDALLEDWATATRYQLSEEWRRALEALAALHGERGDRVEQGRLLRLVLRADPYREQSYRALMTLLALDGRGAEALILYHQLRTLLRVELGTGPDPQTQALASRITQPM
jgi:DNA-binding SARP family transcriptional activator